MKIWKKESDAPPECVNYHISAKCVNNRYYHEITIDQLLADIAQGKVLVDKDSVIEKPSWDDAPEGAVSRRFKAHYWIPDCAIATDITEEEPRPEPAAPPAPEKSSASQKSPFTQRIKDYIRREWNAVTDEVKQDAAKCIVETLREFMEDLVDGHAATQDCCGNCAYVKDHAHPDLEDCGWCDRSCCRIVKIVNLQKDLCVNHTLLDDVVLVPGMEVERREGCNLTFFPIVCSDRLAVQESFGGKFWKKNIKPRTIGQFNKDYRDLGSHITAILKWPEEKC